MPYTTAPTSIKLKADVKFSRIDTDGNPSALFKVANATQFDIQPQSTTETIKGTEKANFGQTLDSYSEVDDLLITLATNRFNGKSLALALMGTESAIATGTTAVTDEEIAIDEAAGFLAHPNIVAASVVIRGINIVVDATASFAANTVLTNQTTGARVGTIESIPDGTHFEVFLHGDVPANTDVVTDGTNTATVSGTPTASNSLAVITTDFTEDTANGKFLVVTSGSMDISELTSVKVNYTYNDVAGSQVVIGADTVIKGRLIVDGENLITNKPVFVDLRQVNIAPNSAITLLGDDRSTITWQGVAETPSGQTDPGTVNLGL